MGKVILTGAYLALCVLTITNIQAQTISSKHNKTNYSEIINTLKNSPKGPFERIRWFCNDGTVLPPKAYACANHGGGRQHGEWNKTTQELRQQGFPLATVYSALGQTDFTALAENNDELAFLLLERFLIIVDDGWIFRHASSYRGALQVEGEVRRADELLKSLVANPKWRQNYFLLLREATRLLPNDSGTEGFSETRALASELATLSAVFAPIRNKIHNRPEAKDAQRVANFIVRQSDPLIIKKANELIKGLEAAFALPDWTAQLLKLKKQAPAKITATLTSIEGLASSQSPIALQIEQVGLLMQTLRENLAAFQSPQLMLNGLRLSLSLEQAGFALFSQLDLLRDATRAQRLSLISAANTILYGMGLLNGEQHLAFDSAQTLLQKDKITLNEYKTQLDYLALASSWTLANLHLQFSSAMEKMRQLEITAPYYYDDRLRSSVLLFATLELERLIADANQLSGLTHLLFDQKVGHGLRRLNPGLARGKLVLDAQGKAPQRDEIILVSETTEDLPPVAGILTEKEGNALSHVQLLARNLGIPNAVISEELLSRLKPFDQQTIVLATSSGGAVHILADNPIWEQHFNRHQPAEIEIKPDLQKLDLNYRQLTDLSQLRASDSGRIVGPKAANLGQLKSHFLDAVTDGLALPFGLFKYYLDKPFATTNQSTYQWMLQNYQRLEKIDDEMQKKLQLNVFLSELRQRIHNFQLEPELLAEISRRLKALGNIDNTGVFIRSDTNVEDLAGFTGAGLNLTLPNVVGFDQIADSIKKVWASPFTERAFAWRQKHMPHPEHVYTAVLLLASVNSDVSGVMVTTDLNNGDNQYLTVAVNEGIGGAVDNQAAETLVINRLTKDATLLQPASASKRRQLAPHGGLQLLPASRNEKLLNTLQIKKLVELSEDIATKYPQFVSDDGKIEPADIEFGFVSDKLMLFQIRPFLQNPNALKNEYLNKMDLQLRDLKSISVNLDDKPLHQ